MHKGERPNNYFFPNSFTYSKTEKIKKKKSVSIFFGKNTLESTV